MIMSTPWFESTTVTYEPVKKIGVKFKRLHDRAVLPTIKTSGSSGADLHAVEESKIQVGQIGLVPLGFAVEFPQGIEMQIRPRSGLALKNGITVLNTPGTVDSDYRGEIKVILINLGKEAFTISPGDRIAQAVFSYVVPVTYTEMEDLEKLPQYPPGNRRFWLDWKGLIMFLKDQAAPQDIVLTSTVKLKVENLTEATIIVPPELRLTQGLLTLLQDAVKAQGFMLTHLEISKEHVPELGNLQNVVLQQEAITE